MPYPLPPVERLREKPLRYVCGWHGSATGYFPIHLHRVVEIVHHPSGSGVTSLDGGRQIEFAPGGTVIYPPLCRHDQRMFTPGEDICLHVEVPPSFGATLFPDALYIPPAPSRTGRGDRFVRDECRNLSRLRPDATQRVELDLRVTALVARLLHSRPAGPRETVPSSPELHLDRARRFVAEHYASIGDVGEVARHVGISGDYLRHLFAAHGGLSLARLLNQTRIERAKELLIHSRLPVKEIAALSGFKTERYLSTRFKERTRLTPGAFRRQAATVSARTIQRACRAAI